MINLAQFIFTPLTKIATGAGLCSDTNTNAINIIKQQVDVINAYNKTASNAVKVAAVLAEALKKVRDGVLDAHDIEGYVEDTLTNGEVKLNSLYDECDVESPGTVIGTGGMVQEAQDPLTSTLRTIRR